MNIGSFIYSMYTTSPDFIEMSFVLTHEGDFIAKGRATIRNKSEIITLKGNLKDTNMNKFKDKNTNVISINTNDLPLYYNCELTDFPIENRKSEINNKDIMINFPKVKIDNNFSFNMFQDHSKFECEMTPLYVVNENKPLLCNLIIE